MIVVAMHAIMRKLRLPSNPQLIDDKKIRKFIIIFSILFSFAIIKLCFHHSY
jgi:hypothetical protein